MFPDVVDPGLVEDLGLAVQLALGLVFARSLLSKLRRPADFVSIVNGYQLIPSRTTPVAAGALVVAESFVTVSCLTGWHVMVAAFTVLMLTVVFAAGTTINLRRGRAIDCGCFGEGEKISPRSLQRLGFIAVAAILLSGGLATGEVSQRSLANAAEQGLFDGGAYLIAAIGISAFMILAVRLALEGRTVLPLLKPARGS